MELIDILTKGYNVLSGLETPKTTGEKVAAAFFDTAKYAVKQHVAPQLQSKLNIFKKATPEEASKKASEYAKNPDEKRQA